MSIIKPFLCINPMLLSYIHIIKRGIWLLGMCMVCQTVTAQVKEPRDTAFFLAHKKGLLGKIGKSLSINVPDPVLPPRGVVKNETEFNKYQGKIIRYIMVKKTGFAKSLNDTIKTVRNIFNDIGDALHTTTSKRVIRNNLFFAPGDTLYPYLLADNERFLRTLTYLQDAKISVQEDENSQDSVDLIVICKDVFPIGGSMDAGSDKFASFEVNDDNLFGSGNRLQVKNLFDRDRKPNYALGFEFIKRNLSGTHLDITMGYDNEAPTFNSGLRDEKTWYLKGDLPLVSPYHVWTGGFEFGQHYTDNGYLPDSIYRSLVQYNYRVADAWIGYNIGARRQLQENFKSRLKKLIAIRAVRRDFLVVPGVYNNQYQINYSNLSTVIGSFTIFEQDFYHTNFLYGFGRNEDVPEGFTLSLTGGWTNRNNVSRPYGGFEYQRNYFSNSSNYFNYIFRAGTYYNGSRFEDISILNSVEYFSKLRKLGNNRWFLRHFVSGSVTQLLNTYLNEPLRLSSDFGIPQLNNPDLLASTRITLNEQSVFYNTWKLVGFSFAPFVFANITYLKPIGRYFETGEIYTSIGGGVRSRNENLVFGTIELKAFYYPRITGNLSPWNITVNTDIRFKYNTQLTKKPDFVTVN